MSLRAVHQVLATLGYGDAIGHEVLGIQRVPRGAGYDFEIFVETADPRLEDLTYDYRNLLDASHPENLLLHHSPLVRGHRGSPLRSRSDGAHLPQHHAAEYFIGVHKQLVELCWKGRRELKAYVTAAILRWAIQSSTARSWRRLASRGPTCCRSCPILASVGDARLESGLTVR